MMTSVFRNKKGGMTIFMCIILSAVILTESILFSAAKQRSLEADIQQCMRLQTSQILCNYNDSLLGYYGLYAISEGELNRSIFDTCFTESSSAQVFLEPLIELNNECAYIGIVDFMKMRFPAIASNEILSRMGSVIGLINKNEVVKNSKSANTSAWLSTLQEYLSGKDAWSSILSNVASFIDVVDFDGKLTDLEAFASQYRMIAEKASTGYLQGDANTTFEDNLLNPETLSGMMSYVDKLLDYDLPEFADMLLLNEYALSFFDSSIDSIKTGSTTNPESNILGTAYKDIHNTNYSDLEYLLTGFENEFASVSAAKILVFDARIVLNLASFLLDKEKTEKALGIAEIVSTAIAVISLGSIVVDPQIVQYIVIYVMAVAQAFSDMYQLLNGESVVFLNHSSISEIPILEEVLMTDYRDYIGFFLLFVKREQKLSRMLTIMHRDCGNDLYVGVRICVTHNDNDFCQEDYYDAYDNIQIE